MAGKVFQRGVPEFSLFYNEGQIEADVLTAQFTGHWQICASKQVLNRPCVTIITNAALSIISTKMSVCFVF